MCPIPAQMCSLQPSVWCHTLRFKVCSVPCQPLHLMYNSPAPRVYGTGFRVYGLGPLKIRSLKIPDYGCTTYENLEISQPAVPGVSQLSQPESAIPGTPTLANCVVFRASGFGFRGSRFGFRGSGFGFRVSGFGVWVSGFWFRGSGFGVRVRGSRSGVGASV